MGCAGVGLRAPVVPYTGDIGIAFNNTAFPVDITFEQNSIGPKMGSTKVSNILGLFSWGDASVHSAARAGGLSRVDHIDSKFFNLLGIYSSYEIIVYGE